MHSSDIRDELSAIAYAYGHDVRDAREPLEALAETLQWEKLPKEAVQVGKLRSFFDSSK